MNKIVSEGNAPLLIGASEFVQEQMNIIPLMNAEEGALLLIDKPYGITSFAVVHKVRRILSMYAREKRPKVGHGGTLDPLATGLLIIGTRRATKALNHLLAETKTYFVTFRLGITSPSYDLETPITVTNDVSSLSLETLESVVHSFVGEQLQEPPQFSAVKHKGKPLYEHARKGKKIELEHKPITIYSISDISISLPYLSFSVECSKGTYIRSIARDIGAKLGVGAVVTELRRTHIGSRSVSNAIAMEQVELMKEYQESQRNKESVS